MSFIIAVTRTARDETREAFNYYENIRVGLGEDFLADLEDRYGAIQANPYTFSYTDSRNILRDAGLTNFPFLVIYKIQYETIVILSVHNTYKRPVF